MRRGSKALAIVAAGLAGLGVHAQTPPKPVGDIVEWLGPDTYPVEALRANEQGRVVMTVSVDSSGKPAGCRIATSSGSKALDEGSCATIMSRAFYEPARDRKGKAVAGEVTVPVRWTLPAEGDAGMAGTIDVATGHMRFPRSETVTRVGVAPDGTVRSCESQPASAAAGPCSFFTVGKKVMQAMTRNGRPIGAQLVLSSSSETIFDP